MATVDEYKAAMNELAAATKDFQPYADFLMHVRVVAGYSIDDFLKANFNIRDQGSRGHSTNLHKYQTNFDKWPTAEALKESGARLGQAFNAAHLIYQKLSAEDREYIKAPPYRPEIRSKT